MRVFVNSDCITLWIGDRLGPVERACLRSVLRQGHRLALYCYSVPEGVPAGVEIRDANGVLSSDKVFLHRRNSFAPFADWFRYELQEREAGIWVDTDVYLLSKLELSRPYLFGEQEPDIINNAVLRLPAGSEALRHLLAPFRENTVPQWMPRLYRWRHLLRGKRAKVDMRSWPWGVMGPMGLTAVARSLGLAAEAQPPEVFYPVPWDRAAWIRDPHRRLQDMITPRTVSIHLWNDCIEHFKSKPAPEGSFLQRLHIEGAE
jgi:hypothetical protein